MGCVDSKLPKYELVQGEMEKSPVPVDQGFPEEIVKSVRKAAYIMVKDSLNKKGGPGASVLSTLLDAYDIEVPPSKLLPVAMIIMHSTPGTIPLDSIMKITDN